MGKDLPAGASAGPTNDSPSRKLPFFLRRSSATNQFPWNADRDCQIGKSTVPPPKAEEIVSDGKFPHLATAQGKKNKLRRLRLYRVDLADGSAHNGDFRASIFPQLIRKVQSGIVRENPRE